MILRERLHRCPIRLPLPQSAMAETDLYLPLKKFLEGQGYEVKSEIHDCDIVAMRGEDPPVIVEMKTKFSLEHLLQGVDRQTITDAVYLAFTPPKRRQMPEIVKLCKRLGLGLLTVSGQFVEAHADPAPYQPRKNAKRKTLLLKEFAHRVGDPNNGGSTRRPIVTAYRQDALRCAHFIGSAGSAKVAHIRAQASVGRAAGILQQDVYGWFLRQERGIYGLSPKGQQALVTFEAVVRSL